MNTTVQKSKGVFPNITKNGEISFRTSITYRRKHISLGSFPTDKEAGSAYQTALRLIQTPALQIEDYEGIGSPLPFEKWVCLINFRDNGLYFRTPIYLKNRYFFYYLSASEILKFDLEDLFYYSTRKIQKRGNHLFLSDYGMQVSLTARYGIRKFSVPGRDYFFLNGDSLDFRYSNIKIINRYFGVLLEKELPKPVYLSKININGSVIIGRYESEILAAIAYNKTLHLLKKAGFSKTYEENYIEGLDSASYEALYQAVPLRKQLLHLISSLTDSKDSPKAEY